MIFLSHLSVAEWSFCVPYQLQSDRLVSPVSCRVILLCHPSVSEWPPCVPVSCRVIVLCHLSVSEWQPCVPVSCRVIVCFLSGLRISRLCLCVYISITELSLFFSIDQQHCEFSEHDNLILRAEQNIHKNYLRNCSFVNGDIFLHTSLWSVARIKWLASRAIGS